MGRLEKHKCVGLVLFHFQKTLPSPGFARRKPLEGEGRPGKARQDKRRRNGAWARQNLNGMALFPAQVNGVISRVTDARHAAVRDQRHGQAFVKQAQDATSGLLFIMFMAREASPWRGNLIPFVYFSCDAGIFTSHRVHFAQDPGGTEGQVFQIADGRAHDI